jgi:PAS domain S-box-containing protein
MALLMETILVDAGYDFSFADTGEKGLKMITEEHPDLIILDYMIPVMKGDEVFRKLMTEEQYKDCRDIPVIMLSAKSGNESKKRELMELGLSVYLMKPFGEQELLNVIDNVLVSHSIKMRSQRLESELLETKNYLENLIQITPASIFVYNLIDDEITFLNREIEKLTGYSISVANQDKSVLFSLLSEDEKLNIRDDLLKSKPIKNLEVPVERKNGDIRWTLQSIVPIVEADRSIRRAEGVVIDITDKKRAEQEAMHRHQELGIINAITKAISSRLTIEQVLHTVMSQTVKLIPFDCIRLTLFNDDYETANIIVIRDNRLHREKMFPIAGTSSEWILKNGEAIVEIDLRKGGFSEDKKLVEEGLLSAIRVPLAFENNTIGVLGLQSENINEYSERDIEVLHQIADALAIAIRNAQLFSELKEANKQVSIAKEFAENILQNVTSGVVTTNLNGQITLLNPAGEEILGWKNTLAIGEDVYNVIKFANGELDDDIFGEVIEEEHSFRIHETEVVRRDGRKIPFGMSIAPLKESGEIVGAVGLFADLTEAKKLEEEAQKIKHLAQMGEMSARIAHETKNSLAALQSGIQFVQMTVPEEEQETFEDLLSEIDRMDKVVKDLLAFSQKPRLNLASVSPKLLLEVPLYLASQKLKSEDVLLVEEYDENLPELMLDQQKMEQVYINLIFNAIQAMPNGGTLTIKVKNTLNFELGAETVSVMISDTGMGIPQENLDKIFSPFYSTKVEGTGLGLSLAKRFVEAHGGRIYVNSKPGEGTQFVTEFILDKNRELEK